MSSQSATGATVAQLTELRPLNARSIALSVLLGSHPPTLPTKALVALAELFDIAPGTMRTALSRLVASGELIADDGRYHLGPAQLQRQRSQDLGRSPTAQQWDRTWHTVIAADDQRELADRREFRRHMANLRFGELRPDIWMRPNNSEAPASQQHLIIVTGGLDGRSATELVSQLWDLTHFRVAAERLIERIETLVEATDWQDHASIPAGFTLAATVLRYLRAEPRLPAELEPPSWPVAQLRQSYGQLESLHDALLQRFLAAESVASS